MFNFWKRDKSKLTIDQFETVAGWSDQIILFDPSFKWRVDYTDATGQRVNYAIDVDTYQAIHMADALKREQYDTHSIHLTLQVKD